MEQRPIAMNKGNMIGASERAKARVKSWMQLADDVIEDTEKSERLNRHECKACFYSSRIGGAAMTYRPCMEAQTQTCFVWIAPSSTLYASIAVVIWK
jgi:hypothetical protein